MRWVFLRYLSSGLLLIVLFLSCLCPRPRHHSGQSTDFSCIHFSSYVFFFFVSFLLRKSQKAPQVFYSFSMLRLWAHKSRYLSKWPYRSPAQKKETLKKKHVRSTLFLCRITQNRKHAEFKKKFRVKKKKNLLPFPRHLSAQVPTLVSERGLL
jgi:hypothetical protein